MKREVATINICRSYEQSFKEREVAIIIIFRSYEICGRLQILIYLLRSYGPSMEKRKLQLLTYSGAMWTKYEREEAAIINKFRSYGPSMEERKLQLLINSGAIWTKYGREEAAIINIFRSYMDQVW